jgi:hypothetical protein
MEPTKRSAAIRQLLQLVAIFLAALLVLNLAGSYLTEKVVEKSSLRLSRIGKGNIDVDAMIVGNSRGVNLMVGDTAHGFPTIFNLAYNGLGRRSVMALTKEFFARGNKARYVFFEASSLWLNTPDCQMKSYWTLLPLLKEAEAPYCPADALAGRFLPLSLYDTEVFLRSTYFAFAKQGDQGWTNDYAMSPQTCLTQLEHGDKHIREGGHSSVSDVRRDVADLRSWLGQHAPGTKLIFVLSPYLTSKPALAAVAANVAEADQDLGVGGYLDLTGSLGPDCRMFADGYHIIGPGRTAVRPAVIKYLREQDGAPAAR